MKKIFYGKAVYDNKEINAVLKVLKNNSLSLIDGPNVKNLEKKVSNSFGKKFGLMVNSGSSANLLALSSFNFKPGSEVITPNLTFSTTVAPIYQLGLIPHFIGAEENKFLANLSDIEKSINKKTVAIMIPNLLGNVCDWKRIYNIAKKHKLKVIEDSADTIGYKYKDKNLGRYSDISTNSFYASHIINGAGSGGIVCFNDYNNYKRAKLLRGWGRSSATFNESENINKRFNIKIQGIDYDAKYVFSDLGYNFLPSEVSAAFALEQLKKLDRNISLRRRNFKILKDFFSNYPDLIKVPYETKFLRTAWLAFPIVIKKNKFFSRKEFQIFFERSNIQTRTIFTGNILRQPVMKGRYYRKVKNIDRVADDVMKNGVLLGCHQGMKINEIKYMCNTFKKLIS